MHTSQACLRNALLRVQSDKRRTTCAKYELSCLIIKNVP
jgi:hypothetical protein